MKNGRPSGFLSGKSFLFYSMQKTTVNEENNSKSYVYVYLCVSACILFLSFAHSLADILFPKKCTTVVHIESVFHLFVVVVVPHFSHYLLPFFNVTRKHNTIHTTRIKSKKWFGPIKWKRHFFNVEENQPFSVFFSLSLYHWDRKWKARMHACPPPRKITQY